jgi:hypothetical protein
MQLFSKNKYHNEPLRTETVRCLSAFGLDTAGEETCMERHRTLRFYRKWQLWCFRSTVRQCSSGVLVCRTGSAG